MNALNIVKQSPQWCQGEHAEPEFTFLNGQWVRSDPARRGSVIEKLQRLDVETDEQFYRRANKRADQIDENLHCARCYR